MPPYVGDYELGTTFHHRFTTVNASGVPTTLGNTPSAQYYVDGGTTAFTAGLTLTADFNSVTGLNSIAVIATTSATAIASGVNVSVQVAAGTVSGVSMVGYPIIEYSIYKRSPLRPATVGLTVVVDANGVVVANVTSISTQVAANVTAYSTQIAANVTAASTNVGAVVTAISTIVPARVTAQGIDVGAIVTAVNTIVPARVTAQGIDIGAIVTAFNTIAPASVTAISTIAPARVTAQGIDIGAIVTAINTIAAARVTSMSASGLASLFLTDSGTTYAGAVAGSPVKEIADNAGGTSLTVTSIASGVWDKDATENQVQGSFGQTLGDSTTNTSLYIQVGVAGSGLTAIPLVNANVTSITTLVPANVTTYSTVIAANVTAASTNIGAVVTAFNTIAPANVTAYSTVIAANVTAFTTIVDANIQKINDVTIVGDGAGTPFNV